MTPLPRPASSVIVRHEGRLLLIRRSNPPSQNMFAFPGGRGEEGETPEKTALRELLEETGLTGKNPQLFATYTLYPDGDGSEDDHFELSVFLVEIEGDVSHAAASSDATELGWYTPQDILTLPVPPSVLDCVERLVKSVENVYNR